MGEHVIHMYIIVNALTRVHSRLQVHVSATVIDFVVEMSPIEEKLDAVLKSLDVLKQEHKGTVGPLAKDQKTQERCHFWSGGKLHNG